MLFSDPRVTRFVGGPRPAEEIRAQMTDTIRRGGNGFVGVWAISNRETQEKIGTTALLPMPIESTETDFASLEPGTWPNAPIEIGYHVLPGFWGLGYATEAARRIVEAAFEATPLESIFATFDPENSASREVLIKAGFRDIGPMKSYGETGPGYRIDRADRCAG